MDGHGEGRDSASNSLEYGFLPPARIYESHYEWGQDKTGCPDCYEARCINVVVSPEKYPSRENTAHS
jgi:hypothetical protein